LLPLDVGWQRMVAIDYSGAWSPLFYFVTRYHSVSDPFSAMVRMSVTATHHTTPHYTMLQRTATHRNKSQHAASICNHTYLRDQGQRVSARATTRAPEKERLACTVVKEAARACLTRQGTAESLRALLIKSQRTPATHYIALQRTATHCNTLHHAAMHSNALQRTATQHTATHYHFTESVCVSAKVSACAKWRESSVRCACAFELS